MAEVERTRALSPRHAAPGRPYDGIVPSRLL